MHIAMGGMHDAGTGGRLRISCGKRVLHG
jgi:hypothetical protein